MSTQIEVLRGRITSLCCGLGYVEAVTPFDFDLQPTTQIDQVFRITSESDSVIGGFNYAEERTDIVEIWVARKQAGAASVAYDALLTDVSSMRAAVIRDGATGGGDFTVPNGTAYSIAHDDGKEYAVLRLAVPVNYEALV